MSHAESRPVPAGHRAAPGTSKDPRPSPRIPAVPPAQVLPFPRPHLVWAVSHYVSLDGAALPVFVRLR